MKLRLLIAGAIVLFSVISFLTKGQVNPVTGEKQRVDMSIDEEIRMGLSSAPEMGNPSSDRRASMHVEDVGNRLVNRLEQDLYKAGKTNPFHFEFHLLGDRRSVNAFALPGGQIFMTEGLYRQLGKDANGNFDERTFDGQVAGVLGHEIGHVIERHGSERMAKTNLTRGLIGAAGVAGGSAGSSNIASYVGNMMQMKYGRGDELESDKWGVKLMLITGYDPAHMLGVMDVLEASAGGGGTPEFMSTHPRPANRKKYIQDILEKIPAEYKTGLR
jgi:predicted Zn-dependent protease